MTNKIKGYERFEVKCGKGKETVDFAIGDIVYDSLKDVKRSIKDINDEGFVFEDGLEAPKESFITFKPIVRGYLYNNLVSREDLDIKDHVLYFKGNPIEMGQIEAHDIIGVCNVWGTSFVYLVTKHKNYDKFALCSYDILEDKFEVESNIYFDKYNSGKIESVKDVYYLFTETKEVKKLSYEDFYNLHDGKNSLGLKVDDVKDIKNAKLNEEEIIEIESPLKTLFVLCNRQIGYTTISPYTDIDNIRTELEVNLLKNDYGEGDLEGYEISFVFDKKADTYFSYDSDMEDPIAVDYDKQGFEVCHILYNIYADKPGDSYADGEFYIKNIKAKEKILNIDLKQNSKGFYIYKIFTPNSIIIVDGKRYEVRDKEAISLIKDKYINYVKTCEEINENHEKITTIIFASDDYEILEVGIVKTKDRGYITNIKR